MVTAASLTTVGGTLGSVMTVVPVQAATGDLQVKNGSVDFGQGGTATITIRGNDGQSMVGKRFEVFKLFNAENAEGGESINYTFQHK